MLNLSLLFYSWSNLHYSFFFVFFTLTHLYLKYNGGFSTVPLLNPKFLRNYPRNLLNHPGILLRMKNVPNTPTPTSMMFGPTERAVLAIPVATSFNPVIIDSSRVNPAEVIFVFVVFVFKSSCKRYNSFLRIIFTMII